MTPLSRPRGRWIGEIVLAAAVTLSVVAVIAQRAEKPSVDVYKTPTCGCCQKWVEHLTANGFTVRTTDLDNLDSVKQQHGVPTDLGSCHTAVVGGYVVEGHVPAGDIQKLLAERPNVAGIAVPSMPAGSPGMEVPGGRVQPYRVLAFEKNGRTSVYSSYGVRSPGAQ